MKKIAILGLYLILNQLQAQDPGTLDTSFALHGISTIDRSSFDAILAFVVQPDGKVVAVGYTEELGRSKLTVLRYLPDGSLDGPFASNGLYEAIYFPYTNVAQAVALQPDGKIVVAGYATNTQASTAYNEELIVLRLNPNGTPDPGFGNNGVATLNAGFNERPCGIRLTTDGKILVAGSTFRSTISNFLVYRLNADGSLDNGFGSSGVVKPFISNGIWNYCYAMELQADGKILLAGEAKSFAGANFALIRLEPDGSYDPSFSGDGKTTNSLSTMDDGAQSMVLFPDGKILLGGYAITPDNKTAIALTRFHSNGDMDDSFGSAGKVITQMGVDYSTVADLCLTGMGNIMVAGTAKRYPTYFDFFLAKYNADGTLDDSFGEQGATYTDYDSHYDGISDAQILPDGKILVAGTGVNTSNSISEYLLAQYWLGEGTDTEDIVQVVASTWAYPNPTHERKITLNYNLLETAAVSLELFSMDGRLLSSLANFKEAMGKQKESVTLPSGLAAGAYLIALRAGDQQTFVKIIVQ